MCKIIFDKYINIFLYITNNSALKFTFLFYSASNSTLKILNIKLPLTFPTLVAFLCRFYQYVILEHIVKDVVYNIFFLFYFFFVLPKKGVYVGKKIIKH